MSVWNLKKYTKFYIACAWNAMNIDIKESGNADVYWLFAEVYGSDLVSYESVSR